MYLTTTTAEDPWMPGDLRPYGDVPMSPAAGVLNYGQGLFEGMKAYRTLEGPHRVFQARGKRSTNATGR